MSPPSKLGRLYVFASVNGAQFSPYVLNAANVPAFDGRPSMLSPVALRLTLAKPERHVSFVSDIDGFVRVMQEVDSPDEPVAKVRVTRRINADLNWVEWLARRFTSWQKPKLTS
jgi:hypothetical protein